MSQMRARTLIYLTFAIALVGFSAWSCGGSKDTTATGNPSPTSSAPPADAPAGTSTPAAAAGKPGEVSLAVGDAVFHQRC